MLISLGDGIKDLEAHILKTPQPQLHRCTDFLNYDMCSLQLGQVETRCVLRMGKAV
jgi:hypothetical protein